MTTPTTYPPLPEGEEMQKVLDAFAQLPTGKFRWQGYLSPGLRPSIALMIEKSGQPSLLQSSAEEGFLFRSAYGYMEDGHELVKPIHDDTLVSHLDSPAAIALASAWMVPLLFQEWRTAVSNEAMAGVRIRHLEAQVLKLEADLLKAQGAPEWSAVRNESDGSQVYGPYTQSENV